jgi:hypothetical protein
MNVISNAPLAIIEAETLAVWERVLKLCELPKELNRHGIPAPDALTQLLARYRSSVQPTPPQPTPATSVLATNEKTPCEGGPHA